MQILDANENQEACAKVNADEKADEPRRGVAWLPLDQDGSQSVKVLRKKCEEAPILWLMCYLLTGDNDDGPTDAGLFYVPRSSDKTNIFSSGFTPDVPQALRKLPAR
ncbi:hypothetical protein PTI98_012067 [Pleurotus ostreatus]|nr:hypothetical protein PTI98_012067 [Pleurotus ostreatus]